MGCLQSLMSLAKSQNRSRLMVRNKKWKPAKLSKTPTVSPDAKEYCAACNRTHYLVANGYVILGSGDLVCNNDACWRVIAKVEKNG